jgi:hypothetical protein
LTAVAEVTAIIAADAVLSSRKNQELAEVSMVTEAARRALFRPPPSRLEPLQLAVVYVAATAGARAGGDLYEAAHMPYGIRLITGDKPWQRSRRDGNRCRHRLERLGNARMDRCPGPCRCHVPG